MKSKPRKRPRIGDVIEIPTSAGFAYAQYTHKHTIPPVYGALLRVLPGIFPERPQDLARLTREPAQFITFFPVGPACNRGIVSIAGSAEIPPAARDFPTFRMRFRDREGKPVGAHWLWDGVKEWKVDALTPQQLRDYPPRGIVNDTLLIERILRSWRHEHES